MPTTFRTVIELSIDAFTIVIAMVCRIGRTVTATVMVLPTVRTCVLMIRAAIDAGTALAVKRRHCQIRSVLQLGTVADQIPER